MNPNNPDVNTPPTEEPTTPSSAPNPAPEAPASVTPEAPVEASADPTTPAAAPIASTPAPAGNSNPKKIVLIASIIGGAVLLAIIGVIVFFLMTSVSKEDYRNAARQFNEVQRAASSLTSDVSGLSYSLQNDDESEYNSDVKAVEDGFAQLKTENDELAKQKAVRVGEGAKLYNAFSEKLKAYTANGTEIVESVKKVRPALVVCNNTSDAEDNAARATALKNCSEELGKVGTLPNAAFDAYIKELQSAYSEYATVFEGIAAIDNPYGSQYEQYKALRDKMYAAADKISSASKTFSNTLKERDEQVSVKDSSKALADYLNEQQR